MDISNIKWMMETYPPATPQDIAAAEAALFVAIPDTYKNFLLASNGAVGNLASLYGAKELIEMNTAYEVQQYAPGYIFIGNDGGGYHLLMKAQADATQFQLVSDGYGVPSERDCIDSFEAWLASEEGNPWRNKE